MDVLIKKAAGVGNVSKVMVIPFMAPAGWHSVVRKRGMFTVASAKNFPVNFSRNTHMIRNMGIRENELRPAGSGAAR